MKYVMLIYQGGALRARAGGTFHPASCVAWTKGDYVGGQCQQLAGGCVDAHGISILRQCLQGRPFSCLMAST